MIISRIVRDFLIILFVIYFAQGSLYVSGSLLSQLSILIIIFISGIYLIKSLLMQEKKDIFFFAWTLFILINFISFLVNPELSAGRPRDAIKNTLGCMLPFYPFFYFARKGYLQVRHLIRFSLLILPIIILQFYFNMNNYIIEYESEENEVVNNVAYSFVALIPYAFLIKEKRIISWIYLGVIIFFIFQSSKRGAIIAASIGFLMYIYFQFKTVPKEYQISNVFIILVLVAVLSFLVYRISISNDFLMSRLTMMLEGDTSNRVYTYHTILNKWFNSDKIIHLFFGYGLAGSVKLSGGLAHNDWLEVLSNFGAVGILVYAFLLFSAFKTILVSEWMPEKRIIMLTMLVLWLFITMISMWYTSMMYFTYSILFGYLTGNQDKKLV